MRLRSVEVGELYRFRTPIQRFLTKDSTELMDPWEQGTVVMVMEVTDAGPSGLHQNIRCVETGTDGRVGWIFVSTRRIHDWIERVEC